MYYIFIRDKVVYIKFFQECVETIDFKKIIDKMTVEKRNY